MKESTFINYNRIFKTKVFKTIDETNNFLESDEKYGFIGENKEGYHVAINSDKGKPVIILSENIDTFYNGKVWLIRDPKITRQYIGSGETLSKAKKDAQEYLNNFSLNQ